MEEEINLKKILIICPHCKHENRVDDKGFRGFLQVISCENCNEDSQLPPGVTLFFGNDRPVPPQRKITDVREPGVRNRITDIPESYFPVVVQDIARVAVHNNIDASMSAIYIALIDLSDSGQLIKKVEEEQRNQYGSSFFLEHRDANPLDYHGFLNQAREWLIPNLEKDGYLSPIESPADEKNKV